MIKVENIRRNTVTLDISGECIITSVFHTLSCYCENNYKKPIQIPVEPNKFWIYFDTDKEPEQSVTREINLEYFDIVQFSRHISLIYNCSYPSIEHQLRYLLKKVFEYYIQDGTRRICNFEGCLRD